MPIHNRLRSRSPYLLPWIRFFVSICEASSTAFSQVALLPDIYISLMLSFHAPFLVQIREGRADGLYTAASTRTLIFLYAFELWVFLFLPFKWYFLWFISPFLFPRVLRWANTSLPAQCPLNDGNPTRSIFAIVFFLRALPLFSSAYVHVVRSSQFSSFSIPDCLDYCNG